MSDGKKYYCFCGSNCKYETMTKEQILAAIAQAVATGSVGDVDTGFVSTIKEKNGGRGVTFWVGTQAQYNALASKEENCMYILTDDTTSTDLLRTVNQMAQDCSAAAKAAADAAQAAKEAAASAWNAVDITDKIALSNVTSAGGSNLTELYISAQYYVYVPAAKMVFFMFGIVFKGKLNKGEALEFMHYAADGVSSIYAPRNIGGMSYPISARGGSFSGEYFSDRCTLYVDEAKDTGEYKDSMEFSGWYYCDGE